MILDSLEVKYNFIIHWKINRFRYDTRLLEPKENGIVRHSKRWFLHFERYLAKKGCFPHFSKNLGNRNTQWCRHILELDPRIPFWVAHSNAPVNMILFRSRLSESIGNWKLYEGIWKLWKRALIVQIVKIDWSDWKIKRSQNGEPWC